MSAMMRTAIFLIGFKWVNLTGFLAILCPASLAAICRGKKKPAGIRRKKHQNWISHERRRWLVEKGLDPPTSASANDRISALCKSDNLWSLPSAICSFFLETSRAQVRIYPHSCSVYDQICSRPPFLDQHLILEYLTVCPCPHSSFQEGDKVGAGDHV